MFRWEHKKRAFLEAEKAKKAKKKENKKLEHFEWLRGKKLKEAKEKLKEVHEFLQHSASALVARRQRKAEERVKRNLEKVKGKSKATSIRIDRLPEVEERLAEVGIVVD